MRPASLCLLAILLLSACASTGGSEDYQQIKKQNDERIEQLRTLYY